MKKDVRIAYVTESLDPSCGVWIVIMTCIAIILGAGWSRPIVIGSKREDNPIDVELPSKLVSKKRKYYRTLLCSKATNRQILEALKGFDIVEIQSISTLAVRTICLLRKMKVRPKIIFHVHVMHEEYLRAWFGRMSFLFRPIANNAFCYCARHADLVIFPSQFCADLFIKRFEIKTPFKVWSAPITIPEKTRSIRGEEYFHFGDRSVCANRPTLLYVGRIGREKNIETLLSVFGKMQGWEEQCDGLILIGGGETSYYRKIADNLPNNAGRRVSFLGTKSRDFVLACNKLATIGISASTTETEGLAILEQMACGLPVVVMDNTILSQAAMESGAGIICAKNECLGELKIMRLLDNPKKRQEMGKQGKEYIAREFSTEKQAKDLIEIYEELLC